MALRTITCCWCNNPSTNQDGKNVGGLAHNSMAQSKVYPTVYMHFACAVDFTRLLRNETDESYEHPLIAEFYSSHDHTRY